MRKPVIAGNWKMYKTLSQAVDTALALKPLVANANHCEVVIALKLLKQFDHDGLNGDIKRGGHLITNQQFGANYEGARDGHALALPPRQLVRISIGRCGW